MLRVFTAEVRVSLFYEYMIDTRIDAAEWWMDGRMKGWMDGLMDEKIITNIKSFFLTIKVFLEYLAPCSLFHRI